MSLTQKELTEFKEIIAEDYGISLCNEKATNMANWLVRLGETVLIQNEDEYETEWLPRIPKE